MINSSSFIGRQIVRKLLIVAMLAGMATSLFSAAPSSGLVVSAQEVRADQFGISGNAFPWEDHWDAYSRELQASGAGWARVELRWEAIQPSRDEWRWTSTDQVIAAYDELGFQQMGLIAYSVEWASGGGGSGPVLGPPTDLDAWERYVRAVAERYGDRIDAWEIWNEPDVAMFWGGVEGGDPQLYFELLKRAHRAIKAVDPDATVLNGGVTGTRRGAAFLQTLLDLGAGQYLDALGIHGYFPEGTLDNDTFINQAWPDLRAVRERAGLRFWITEFGWTSGYVPGASAGSEAEQAVLIPKHAALLFNLGGVEKVFLFQFKDPGNRADYYGVMRTDGTPKPALTSWATLVNRLRGLRFERQVDVGNPSVMAMRFSGADRTVDVIWSRSGEHTIDFATGQREVTVWRGDGSSENRTVEQGQVPIQVGSAALAVGRPGPAPAAGGPARCQYFPETDRSLCDGFLDFWERYGGLMIFGYPVSHEVREDGRTVQYLERSKFEYHPESFGTDWAVVGELVGRTVTQGRAGEPAFLPLDNPQSDANCNAYVETGHKLCGKFRDHWRANGGLWMFGYPISEEFEEGGYVVQYFERARFEWHPDRAGTPFEVLLGRLGYDLFVQRYLGGG